MELAELVADVDDITDPTNMEKLLSYLDELQAEDEDFMQSLTNILSDAVVTWPQPWYQHSCSLTRPLEKTGENGVETFKTDSFDKDENKLLAKNWKKFRKMYNVPNKPECFARWKNRKNSRNPNTDVEKTRQFVTAFLAKGLERNLYQVYMHFVTLYGAPVKGPYSEIEEKIMSICFYHKPNKAVPYLALILGREPRGISNRMKILSNGKLEKKRLKWQLPLATKLVQSLMRHSGMQLDELKYAKFDQSVWLKVQEDMDQHYTYLQKFWYLSLHVQLFVTRDVKLQKLRKKILKRLKPYKVWTDIRWKNLLKNLPDGFTHGFLYRIINMLICKYPGNYRTDPLLDVIEFGFEQLKRFKEKNYERRLRTLQLDEEGNLRIVKYSEIPNNN